MCVCVFVCLLLFFFLLLLVNVVKLNWWGEGGRGRGAFLLFQLSFVLLSEMGFWWEPQIGITYSYTYE